MKTATADSEAAGRDELRTLEKKLDLGTAESGGAGWRWNKQKKKGNVALPL